MLSKFKTFFKFGSKPTDPDTSHPPPPIPPKPGPPPIPGNRPFAHAISSGHPILPEPQIYSQSAANLTPTNAPEYFHKPQPSLQFGAPIAGPAISPAYNTVQNAPDWSNYWQFNAANFPNSNINTSMSPYFHPYPQFAPPQQPANPVQYTPIGPYMPAANFHAPPQSWAHIPTANVQMAAVPAPLHVQPAPPVQIHADRESPSYQWPDGDVKLECTAGQEPIGWDDEGWKWRSSGSRKKGVPDAATNVDKRVCLGVFHCSCINNSGAPSRFFRPKSSVDARKKQFTETCHLCHSTLVYVPCEATLTYYRVLDQEGTLKVVRHHIGRHGHARPPVTRLTANETEALDLQVRQHPDATAQELRAAAPESQVSLGDINTILLNARKARQEVEKSKVRLEIIAPAMRSSGFQMMAGWLALKNSFESPWIAAGDMMDRQFVCMQTPFMRDVLLRDSVQSWHTENLQPESGRHGIITDGTHDFFKEGILLTSLVFSQVVLRWVVVLYTWIGSQNQEHHLPHFKQLVEVIAQICTAGLGFTFDDKLFSAILDFSNAQRNGFIEAFVDYMSSRIPGWNELSPKSQSTERTSLRSRAKALLIGCKVHWRRSTHKIKQVIAIKYQYRFDVLIGILEASSTTGAEFLQAVADIYSEFPRSSPLAFLTMSAELRARLPSSTNGAESAHNLLYNAAGKKHDIFEGIRRLFRVQRETEMLYEAVLTGDVQPRFQGLKPQPMSRLTKTWFENDGRAPDTRERLAVVAKLEADLVAQKSALTESERFAAANASAKSVKAGVPGARAGEPSLDRCLVQSYKWDSNSCFIDAPLEAYFRIFVAMGDAVRAEFLRRIRTDAPNTGLRDVVEHLWLRGLLSGLINQKSKTPKDTHPSMKKLNDALLAGQLNVKRLIASKWDGGEFVAGMASCSRTWLNQMVTMETSRDVQKYFGLAHTTHHIGTTPGDLFLAQAYIDPESQRPSLQDYLVHAIPRVRYGTSRTVNYSPVHSAPPIPCSHPACHATPTVIRSVSTEWPLIFRIDPLWRSYNSKLDEPLQEVSCPLTLRLSDEVEYELIARVIFYPGGPNSVGHYVTKARLWNKTYIYNDLHRDGTLTEFGPLECLGGYDPDTSYVVYLRTSKASRTSRTLAQIQLDFAKLAVPQNNVIVVPDDSDDGAGDEIDTMLMDSLTSPAKRTRSTPRLTPPLSESSQDRFFTPEEEPQALGAPLSPPLKSPSPSPLFCQGCGVNEPDGDGIHDEVQCEQCHLWAHIACLNSLIDWHDPDVHFICTRCHDPFVDLFKPGEVVMMPMPGVEDWRGPDTVWYPASFVKRHKRNANKTQEYQFEWLECNDGIVFNSADSPLPSLMLRTFYRARKFCQEIDEIKLPDAQIGKISLPFYMDPDCLNHENPQLTKIFEAALPQIAKILFAWDDHHPVVAHFNKHFLEKKKIARRREAGGWMASFGLIPTPELEAVIMDPLLSLMQAAALDKLQDDERSERVMGVGSALLQLLATQHELQESLDLNGDTLEELLDGSIIPCVPNGKRALVGMFASRKSMGAGTIDQQLAKFKRKHMIYDAELRPPTFVRSFASRFNPRASIPLKIKRTSNAKDDVERPAKRAKTGRPASTPSKPRSKRKAVSYGDEEKPVKKVKVTGEKQPIAKGGRKLRSRTVV
ncbi:hypothetical protein C8R43DRAFT_1177615 [Mycena crocata]|nr:hypothetical protein C8R43DRAFT_1177615 [Mycena crocata]